MSNEFTLFAKSFDTAPGILAGADPNYEEGTALPITGWLFDQTDTQYIFAECPTNGYTSGDIEAYVGGQSVVATTGDVTLKIAFAAVGTGDDIRTATFGTESTVTATVTGVDERIIFSFTSANDITPPAFSEGDYLVMRLRRDPDDVNDDAAGDFEVTDVRVIYA